MPSFTIPIDLGGPTVQVYLSPTKAQIALDIATFKTQRQPIATKLLIDTGASHSSIDARFVAELGLVQVGVMPTLTPSTGPTPVDQPQYDIDLAISAGHNGERIHYATHRMSACDFSSQGIGGLFGRDLLAKATLIYSGQAGNWTMSF